MRLICRALLAIAFVLAAVVGSPAAAAADPGYCDVGELCLWPEPGFEGAPAVHSLADTPMEECVPVEDARAFVNRLSRPVTVYQDVDCATEAEFDTYPGGGTYVPAGPFVVRAVQIWTE